MHFFFFKKSETFFTPNRLVFENAEKIETTVIESPPSLPEKKEDDKATTREEKKDLKETVEENIGEAKDYAEAFSKAHYFIPVALNLKASQELNPDPNSPAFFENWLNNPKQTADFFRSQELLTGKGKNAFIKGLESYDSAKGAQTEEFLKSFDALTAIVTKIRTYLQQTDETKLQTSEHLQKSAFGDVFGEAWKNLKQNYKRSSGEEKILTIGAIAIGAWLIHKYKDRPIYTDSDITYSKLAWFLAGCWGVNYLAGKVTKDDKTLLQRVDIGRGIDDFPDNPLKAYGYKEHYDDSEAKFRTYKLLLGKDVRELFRLYDNAVGEQKREIEPRDLGFHKGEIDKYAAFEVIEKFVKMAALNEIVRQRYDEGKTEPLAEGEKNLAQQPTFSRDLFKNAYVQEGGRFSAIPQMMLEQAILAEYTAHQTLVTNAKTWTQDLEDGHERRLAVHAYRKAKEGLTWTYEKAKEYGVKASDMVLEYGGKALDVTKEYVAWPILARYRKYAKAPKEFVKSKLALWQEKDLQKVLPQEFHVETTKPEILEKGGLATIMGFPGIPFEVKVRKDDGKDVAIIDNIEFLVEEGNGGANQEKARKLASGIQERAEALFKERGQKDVLLQNKKITWDSGANNWQVEGITSTGKHEQLRLSEGDVDLRFTITPDGKNLEFSKGAEKIDDFEEIHTHYEKAKISEAIWDSARDPKVKELLKGLPVTVDDITSQGIITGKLAGLKFIAKPSGTPPALNNGVELQIGGAGKQWSTHLDSLSIDAQKGGEEFARAVTDKIFYEDSYFRDPFLLLQAQMDNTSESVLSRIKEFSETKLWIIPTNIKGLLNGKILQRQWGYTLEFKMKETTDIFQEELLKNKKISDIPALYKTYIEETHNYLTNISQYIEGLSEEDKAKEFHDLLRGNANPSKGRPIGLERFGYTNQDYINRFEKYQNMIIDSRYNYAGLEGLDAVVSIWGKEWEASGEAYEAYEMLLRVWSKKTRNLANSPSLNTTDKNYLDRVIDKVHERLERLQKENGVITAEDFKSFDL